MSAVASFCCCLHVYAGVEIPSADAALGVEGVVEPPLHCSLAVAAEPWPGQHQGVGSNNPPLLFSSGRGDLVLVIPGGEL